MERGPSEYTQSGLPSPYPSNFGDNCSETSVADQPSAAAAPYPVKHEYTSTSSTATPTSDFYPTSGRSASFPEHIRAPYATPGASSGSMAQQQSSPSLPQSDGRNHQPHSARSDNDVPIDPSIAQASPTYAQHPQHSPYAPSDMSHGYPYSSGMYAPQRPDWGGYSHGPPLTPGHPMYGAPQGQPPGRQQVYSFVPIPGAQQHKRPRRRYEEIERMYKCGWNGCEKAYGTLNHLNAHVTMQSHGTKRTPEEFKEIRKEWKARKKEEENARKAAEEERQRAAQQAATQNGGDSQGPDGQPAGYPGGRPVQLPPIGYQSAGSYPAPPGSAGLPGQQPLPEYQTSHMYPPHYTPHSPYTAQGQPPNMYSQSNGSQPPPQAQ